MRAAQNKQNQKLKRSFPVRPVHTNTNLDLPGLQREYTVIQPSSNRHPMFMVISNHNPKSRMAIQAAREAPSHDVFAVHPRHSEAPGAG